MQGPQDPTNHLPVEITHGAAAQLHLQHLHGGHVKSRGNTGPPEMSIHHQTCCLPVQREPQTSTFPGRQNSALQSRSHPSFAFLPGHVLTQPRPLQLPCQGENKDVSWAVRLLAWRWQMARGGGEGGKAGGAEKGCCE